MQNSAIKNEAEMQAWIQNRLDGGVKFIVQKEIQNDTLKVTRLLDVNGKMLVVDWCSNLTSQNDGK